MEQRRPYQSYTAATSSSATPMRPATPEQDSINAAPPRGTGTNPFGTPLASGPASQNASSSAVNLHSGAQAQKYFHSRRVRKGEIERPWLERKDPREKWVTIIPLIGLALGFAFAAFLVYDGLKTVVKHEYCPILDDDFSAGLNTKVWTKEAEVGGFGYGFYITLRDEHALTRFSETVNSSKQLPTTPMFSFRAANWSSNQLYRILP